jgi:hypothetical protein
VCVITHLHLLPRLRTRGAIPLLPLYAFMPWKGTKLHVHFSTEVYYKRTYNLCIKQCLLAINYKNGDEAKLSAYIWKKLM